MSDKTPKIPIKIRRLRVRAEFLRANGGRRAGKPGVLVQCIEKPGATDIGAGFTASRKVGNAVIRNRARRRLREASRVLLPLLGVAGADYVFIARQETGTAPWPRLLDDMETALISLRRRLSSGDGAPQPGSDFLSSARA